MSSKVCVRSVIHTVEHLCYVVISCTFATGNNIFSNCFTQLYKLQLETTFAHVVLRNFETGNDIFPVVLCNFATGNEQLSFIK